LDHLSNLESESIEILREVQATAANPVMLYSIGKDSSVMLRLAQKAFFPGAIPFPLMHIDTGWKFPEMIEFRDRTTREIGFKLISFTNPRGLAEGIGPFSHGSSYHTDVMKTEALKLALDAHGFDVAFGGARRDEEKSRAKERIFSFRGPGHRWDPKSQRPELWSLYNAKINAGESIRVFPISNWTEADIWSYIQREDIPIVPLYFSAERPVVLRDGQWIMKVDERMSLEAGERLETRPAAWCWSAARTPPRAAAPRTAAGCRPRSRARPWDGGRSRRAPAPRRPPRGPPAAASPRRSSRTRPPPGRW
jgi:sulfate adenylyltransferase subunit 2